MHSHQVYNKFTTQVSTKIWIYFQINLHSFSNKNDVDFHSMQFFIVLASGTPFYRDLEFTFTWKVISIVRVFRCYALLYIYALCCQEIELAGMALDFFYFLVFQLLLSTNWFCLLRLHNGIVEVVIQFWVLESIKHRLRSLGSRNKVVKRLNSFFVAKVEKCSRWCWLNREKLAETNTDKRANQQRVMQFLQV